MSLDQTSEYKVYKVSYKESFGCLKSVAMAITNNLETPMFEQGRQDRTPVKDEFLDLTRNINKIRVRVFQERGMHFITGIQFCHVEKSDKSHLLGELDLHDYGNWKEHRMEDGDQIIGIYGL